MEQIVNQFIEKVKSLIEKVDQRDVVYAKILQQKKEATLPESEVQKVTEAVKEAVQTTQCSMPDTESLTEELADGVLCKVTEAIMSAVEEKIKDTPVKLEHHHTHVTTYDLARYADKGARNLVLFLAGLCTILTLWSVGSAFWYFQSESYWAKEFRDILFSDVTTETEMKQLREGTYTVGCLPREFSEDPGAVKVKIKQNKAIIEQRRRQAEKNKGRYSSQPALVR